MWTYVFLSLMVVPNNDMVGLWLKYMFTFVRHSWSFLWLYYFALISIIYENSSFSISLAIFDFFGLCNLSHSARCDFLSIYDINMYFLRPNDIKNIFHMLFIYLLFDFYIYSHYLTFYYWVIKVLSIFFLR